MQVTRRALMGASAMGVALAAGCTPKAQSGDLNGMLDRLSTNILKDSPEYATSLAVSEEQAGGRYIDRMSDVSRAGKNTYRGILEAGLQELQTLNRASLSKADAVTYDVVTTSLQNDIDAAKTERGNGATAPYVVTQLTGVYQGIPDFLDSQHPITNRDQADAYITRLTGYAHQLDQETQQVGDDYNAGFRPPSFAIEGALKQLGRLAAQRPEDTVLVKSIDRRLGEIEGFAAADRTALVDAAKAKVRDEILPAYHRQIEALQAQLSQANEDAGIWHVPGGDAIYATALKSYTTTSMTPDEIHQMGADLAASLTSQMDALLKAQGLTRGSVAERVRSLYTRPDQLYPNTDAGRAACLADLNRQVQTIRARMPEVCGVLAKADLQIKRVPPDTEAGAPGGYYNGAALDGSRPGSYYINLRDMGENPKFTLPTLTYHEGIPGHHWQISIAQEAGELPFIRRALMGFNAYAEGWGLYAEQLADEMGMYANDAWGKIGYLRSAAFRASRLVVDTGMHAKHWTRDQAIQSMMDVTGDNKSSVTTEIERYCVWPGQACGYMVGRQTITRLREEARTALGSKFDIKGFHDVVLTNGSTPLSVTEALVHDWTTSLAHS
ncbi:MAG TPA: DUF885 family protein [Caulobacterales bacterium]|nr:DUF885 family protein [Caulobacterales bacterium]